MTNLIAIAVLGTIAGLWSYSDRIGRLRLAAAEEDARVIAGPAALPPAAPELPPWRTAPWVTGTGELPVIGSQPRCPNPACRSRRCRAAREGRDCQMDGSGHSTAYAAGRPLPRDGHHSLPVALAKWLVGDWAAAPLPVATRRQLGRLAGLTRVPAIAGGEVTP